MQISPFFVKPLAIQSAVLPDFVMAEKEMMYRVSGQLSAFTFKACIASIDNEMKIKKDPNTRKVQKKAIYYDKTQHATFRVSPFFKVQNKPLFQNTKQRLNG